MAKETIPQDLYDDLTAYANLMDIAYCISPISKIESPFQCNNNCSSFPNMQIVQQWTSDDFNLGPFIPIDYTMPYNFKTTGYIAIDHEMKIIVLGLRGTRSFKDTLIDINSDMINIYDVCIGCKIHRGFYKSFGKTWDNIGYNLKTLIQGNPGYRIIINGHSLGGVIGILLGVEILKFEDNLLCITMGQPMIGNKFLASFINQVFNLDENKFIPEHQGAKLIRVTHKNDPIVKLPLNNDGFYIKNEYKHCSNEIFINEEQNFGNLPSRENIWFCQGWNDLDCSYGMSLTNDNSEHLNYFRTMGKCGI
ncbi:Feruloyl esterase A [Wickerhamomyces ciferrii]|uniref:triacylglycerol lipase n=1 Tax=Wickerhamomyces ciferrii (strain ATCC 14091 / BCRC 22168 / CBS 111 / JCM 3599 / NBRC 0793 / NRRL Y-1031 F-60-10) TaxID=1206466 RepID=K0K8X3_WICCF|nr:Feruloyl esterase A [Wickerhamomyces ciferrii]CCH41285.1 Feruloyl esterase A [Wickerhamomyces ciferrii]